MTGSTTDESPRTGTEVHWPAPFAEQPVDATVRVPGPSIPAAENSISGNAFRPGDVLPSRNGMSVEIGNTDAEGRLVLADAISLACEDAPDTASR